MNLHIIYNIAILIFALIPFVTVNAQERVDTTAFDSIKNSVAITARKKGGLVIIGSGKTVRACNAFGATNEKLEAYADVVNKYKETFPQANVYFIAIPTPVEYYLPNRYRDFSRSERDAIDVLFNRLRSDVKKVDAYYTLRNHVTEPIYSRTDHHWAPLGAYYAAEEFAKVAEVPFKDLSNYEKCVIQRYIGSFKRYDVAIAGAPEEFVYYVPKDATYNTTYVTYTLDKARRNVIRETAPTSGNFYIKFNDGSGGAYCTFMGGDSKLTKVETGVKNGRRLVILKDSFGNALPGYLFYSFEEIHVIDCRYYTQNFTEYVEDNKITDILFANNMAHTCATACHNMYYKYLTQNPKRPTTNTATTTEQ